MKNILVYERALLARMRIREALESIDVKLIEVETEHEAVQSLHKFKGKLDLMIIEVGSEMGSDFDMVRKFKSIYHELPLVILTASNKRSDFIRGIQAGASDYILKPFENEVFKGRIISAMMKSGTEPVIAEQSAKRETAHAESYRLDKETGELIRRSAQDSFLELLKEELYRARKGAYPLTIFSLVFHLNNDHELSFSDQGIHEPRTKLEQEYLAFAKRHFDDIRSQLWTSDEVVHMGPQVFFGILPFCPIEGYTKFKDKMIKYLNDDPENRQSFGVFHWHVLGMTVDNDTGLTLTPTQIVDMMRIEIERDFSKEEEGDNVS